MFEAIVTLCLALPGEADIPCRDQLLPGYEAETTGACSDALETRPPDLVLPEGSVLRTPPQCAPLGPALGVTEIAPGVFAHEGLIAEPDTGNLGDTANLGFVIGDDSVAVIDTGSARWMGEALWRAVRAETGKPVSHVILTHMHPDHVFGAAPFAETGARVVGHAGLERALDDRQANYRESLARLIGPGAFLGTRAVPVDMAVAGRASIDLGGRLLDLRAWPAAHTANDLTVFDRATGTMFTGDLLFHLHVPALDGNLRGWQTALTELEGMDIARVVPGHGTPGLAWHEAADDVQRYLSVLYRDTRAAIAEGMRLGDAVGQIAQSEAPRWQLFDAFNARNATVAFTELEWE